MTPDDRAWMQALQDQTNSNSVALEAAAKAIEAMGATLNPLAENIALANVLLTSMGILCAEIAADSPSPYGRLEEILASFETGMEQAIAQGPQMPAMRKRILKQIDMLRDIAEQTLQDNIGT